MPCPFQLSKETDSSANMEHAAQTMVDSPAMAPSGAAGDGCCGVPSETATLATPSFFPSLQDTMIKYDSVFPRCFTGGKLGYTKLLSNNLQITHSMKIPTSVKDTEGYRFGATFVGTSKSFGPSESYPLLMGETDIHGNTTALAMHHLGDRLRLRYRQQFSQGQIGNGMELGVEYRGSSSHIGATLSEPDLLNTRGGYALSYLRKFYGGLDAGVKIEGLYNPQMPEKHLYYTKYIARYETPKWSAVGQLGDNSLNISYQQKVAENVEVAVGLDANRQEGAVARLGYQLEIPNMLTFRASYDTDWNASAVIEKRLSPVTMADIPPTTLAISGMLNHVTGQAAIGVGLNIMT